MEQDEYFSERAKLISAPTEEHASLFREAQSTGERILRRKRFPSHYSPSGTWDEPSIQDAVSQWMTDRLVKRGDLKRMALLTQDIHTFRAKLKTSLRQDLLDRLERTEARNLYQRTCATLEQDDRFECVGASKSRQHQVWATDGNTSRFQGEDRALVAAAFAAGDFSRIHYAADAGKLSPVLTSQDLADFLHGLLGHGAMSVTEMLVAIDGRYDLSGTSFTELDDNVASPQYVADSLLAKDAAAIMVDELTPQQLDVLRRRVSNETVRDIANALGCSVGTVSNELRKIRDCHRRLGIGTPDALNTVVDLAFQRFDEHVQKATQL